MAGTLLSNFFVTQYIGKCNRSEAVGTVVQVLYICVTTVIDTVTVRREAAVPRLLVSVHQGASQIVDVFVKQ